MPRLIEFKDRDEWLASRSQEPWPIGASDAAKIACGKGFEVWREKKLRYHEEGGDWLELGHVLEPAILEAGRRILKWDIETFSQTNTYAHDRVDWVRCTPDGIRLCPGMKGTANCKNISVNNDRYWDYRNGTIPHDHTLAAHWEILTTGTERAYVLALVGGAEVVPFTIERDDDTIRGLYRECKAFRERYLIGDEEPEPDASPETARAFAARVTYEEGAEILFDGKVAEAAIRLTEIEAVRKPLDEEEAQLKNVVRQAMANAKVGRAPNGVEWAWTEGGKSRQLRKRGVKA